MRDRPVEGRLRVMLTDLLETSVGVASLTSNNCAPLTSVCTLTVIAGLSMVRLALQLRAVLENVTNLQPDSDEFRWYLKLRCANCGETTNWIYITELERVPVKGSRGSAHFVAKCKMCARDNTLEIMEGTVASYTSDDSGQFKTVVAFDCRGVEPVAFDPRAGFTAVGENSSSTFSDISLSDKEWFDYDENSQKQVSITEVEYQFVKL